MDVLLGLIGFALTCWGAYSLLGVLYPFKPFHSRMGALKSFGCTFGALYAVVNVTAINPPKVDVDHSVAEVTSQPETTSAVANEIDTSVKPTEAKLASSIGKTEPEKTVAVSLVEKSPVADSEEVKKLNDWIDRYAHTLAHDPQRRQTCRSFVEEHKLKMPNSCLDSNSAKGSFGSTGRVISTATMASFSECKSKIWNAAASIGSSPIVVVDTDIMKMVRFRTNDGSGESVLVTCSAPDRKMVITISG